jgi:hypothetical protein
MTICIATICDGGRKAIVISDRMITAGSPLNIKFEPKIRKSGELSPNCMALTSGSALAHMDLFRNVKERLSKAKDLAIGEIAECVKEEFRNQRIRRAEELHLRPRGLDMQSFYANLAKLPAEFSMMIDNNIQNQRYELDIIITGIDKNGEAHIYSVVDPGVSECFDGLGFNAIGSGTSHAISTFTYHLYTPDFPLERALYIALVAKKNAERAPGVGDQTDIFIMTTEGIKELSEDQVAALEALYKEQKPDSSIDVERIKKILGV